MKVPPLFITVILGLPFLLQGADAVVSEEGRSSVRIVDKVLPSANPDFDYLTLEVLAGGKVVAREPTYGHILDAFWSADGKWLAVNNRRENSKPRG